MDATSGNWRTLAAAYGEGSRCPAREAAVLTAALLADLSRLHRTGSVHGAVDPEHILVAQGGRARLGDSAHGAADAAYQAPEVHAGLGATPRSDLFSAGVVLYRLLTGMNPFAGSPALVRQRITNMIPPRPSELQTGIARAFDGILEKALAKKPEDRYTSAEAFAEALMRAMVPGGTADPDETLATTVVRRPPEDATVITTRGADATVFKVPDPDATMLKMPVDDATVMKSPNLDATLIRMPSPDATIMRSAPPPRQQAPGTPPSASPPVAPAAAAPPRGESGGKSPVVGIAIAVLAAAVAAGYFFMR